jgi:hypothetical protein
LANAPRAAPTAAPKLAPEERCIADQTFARAVGEAAHRRLYEVAAGALEALLHRDGARLARYVDPARGLRIQWASPIPQSGVVALFSSAPKVRGWCEPSGSEVSAAPRELLQRLLTQKGHDASPTPENRSDLLGGAERDVANRLDASTFGPWSVDGAACWSRGKLFPYHDEVAIGVDAPNAPRFVLVLSNVGETPYLVGVLNPDVGVPCD